MEGWTLFFKFFVKIYVGSLQVIVGQIATGSSFVSFRTSIYHPHLEVAQARFRPSIAASCNKVFPFRGILRAVSYPVNPVMCNGESVGITGQSDVSDLQTQGSMRGRDTPNVFCQL